MIDRFLMIAGAAMFVWCMFGLLVLYGLLAFALAVGGFVGGAVAVAAWEDKREREELSRAR